MSINARCHIAPFLIETPGRGPPCGMCMRVSGSLSLVYQHRPPQPVHHHRPADGACTRGVRTASAPPSNYSDEPTYKQNRHSIMSAHAHVQVYNTSPPALLPPSLLPRRAVVIDRQHGSEHASLRPAVALPLLRLLSFSSSLQFILPRTCRSPSDINTQFTRLNHSIDPRYSHVPDPGSPKP